MYPIKVNLNERNADRFGLSFLFEKYYTAEQKIDHLILNEMIDLQNRAKAAGISVAFFKGMVEKTDTYEDYAVKRTQKDIDLLVSLDDVSGFCSVCEQAGYTVRDNCNGIPQTWILKALARQSCHHLPRLFKKIQNGMLTVALEVHIAIDADWRIDQMHVLHSDDMISERQNLKKYPQLYTLHVYDRLIVSLHHVSKHFLANFLTYYYCPSNPLFDCKTLADAYFILLKYGDEIDSATLLAKARTYGFMEHIRFAANMLTLLFQLEGCQKRLAESILKEPYVNTETDAQKILPPKPCMQQQNRQQDCLTK